MEYGTGYGYRVPSEPCLKHKTSTESSITQFNKKITIKVKNFYGFSVFLLLFLLFHFMETLWMNFPSRSLLHVWFPFKHLRCTFSSFLLRVECNQRRLKNISKKKTDTNVKWKDCRFFNKIEQMEKENKDSREVRKHLQHPSQVNIEGTRTEMIFILYKMKTFFILSVEVVKHLKILLIVYFSFLITFHVHQMKTTFHWDFHQWTTTHKYTSAQHCERRLRAIIYSNLYI